MQTIYGLDTNEPNLQKSVLLIGNFDGLHRGHQQLLTQGALFAADENAPLVVLTFEPHPLAILRPQLQPQRLMTLQAKLALLAEYDVDITVVAKSTPEFLALEPEEFIDLVVRRFRPLHIVEGTTFGFGRHRKGTSETLKQLGPRFGFNATIIEPVRLQIEHDEIVPVSSSVIRSLILQGKVHRAALCLARPYTLVGNVVTGAGRGTPLGFPTANIEPHDQLIPADGVYAGNVFPPTTDPAANATPIPAGISIGTNPTFDGHTRQVEAHLLDFDGDLRGQTLRIEFNTWMRPQRKFASADELSKQIAVDIQAIRTHAAAAIANPVSSAHLGETPGDTPSTENAKP